MSKKILFISNDLNRDDSGGKAVSFRNLRLLTKNSEGNKVDIISFGENKNAIYGKNYEVNFSKKQLFIKNLFLYAGSIDRKIEKEILNIIEKENYDIIFLDTSLFGRIAKKVYKMNLKTKIITFFHNVEYFYYKERMKIEGIKYFPLVLSSYYNEKFACSYSNKLIAINNRDKEMLEKKYNTKIEIELPVSFEDKFDIEKCIKNIESNEIKILFVGSYFFANVEGITWFAKNVMPKVNAKLYIIGKGMEALRDSLSASNVEVIGGVDELSEYYYNVNFVVAPIFSGSGMKVKTAEALMYGKTIFGTTEAFEGYDLEFGKIGEKCNTKDEFIEKINNYINNNRIEKFNKYSRKCYLEKYSNEVLEDKINRLLKEL